MTSPSAPDPAARPKPGWFGFALDFGPLLIFFLAYRFTGVLTGTAVFMIAIIAAVLISKIKLGHVAPMLWLSAILVVGFGALTIYFHDPRFIQVKPTIIYAMFAILLFGGWLAGRPMLKYVLEAAYDGLSDAGWLRLSLHWAGFFAGMAVLNEVLRARLSFDAWLVAKLWVVPVLSFLFVLANIPLLTRHGVDLGQLKKDPMIPPPD